ncbi:MAG: AI-2E family transporter [Candidatus Promineifilaceae bacterium]
MSNQLPSSPKWSSSSKRLIVLILFGLAMLGIYRLRQLLLPFIMALIVAYLIEPIVNFLEARTPLKRIWAILVVYLVIIAALISIPVSAIPPIATQINNFINNTPKYLVQLGEFLQEPITVSEDIEIPIDQLALNQAYDTISQNIISLLRTAGSQTLTLFGSIASATISTVGWTVVVLFLSFYMVKDHAQLFQSLLDLIPPSYHNDVIQLSNQIGITWNAFLRGQLLLCLVVGFIVLVMALVIGLPNALVLALIASIAELIPTLGPVIAAIPAVFIAFFQGQGSWLGSMMSPFWFAMLVVGLYGIIYQTENYVLVPRIMGHHLRLHPLVVILAALAGASVAGFLGILLAAPVLASARLLLWYVYRKLLDEDPFPENQVAVTAEESVDTAVSKHTPLASPHIAIADQHE